MCLWQHKHLPSSCPTPAHARPAPAVPETVPSVSPVPEVSAWSCSLCPITGSHVPKQGTALCPCPHFVPWAGSSSSLQGHPGALLLWPPLPTLLLSIVTVAQPPLVCSFICSLGKEMEGAGRVIKQQSDALLLCFTFPMVTTTNQPLCSMVTSGKREGLGSLF